MEERTDEAGCFESCNVYVSTISVIAGAADQCMVECHTTAACQNTRHEGLTSKSLPCCIARYIVQHKAIVHLIRLNHIYFLL
jgi:hypothetical protein